MQTGSKQIAAVINVTPLIDVLLVLLIVFMLLPTHTHGLKSELPDTEAAAETPGNPQYVVVHVQPDGSLQVDSQPVLPAELATRLQSLFATRPDGVLFVDAASELHFAEVASVIDTARGAGIERIGLLTGRDR
jgi:biopolymer transport protein TolR